MTYRELNDFKISVYKNYIKQRYGEKELETLEKKMKNDIGKKILEIKDKDQFDKALIGINSENIKNDDT